MASDEGCDVAAEESRARPTFLRIALRMLPGASSAFGGNTEAPQCRVAAQQPSLYTEKAQPEVTLLHRAFSSVLFCWLAPGGEAEPSPPGQRPR